MELSTKRINSIDVLRGIVMIIMALDHTRDFFYLNAMKNDPLNLETTTAALFFTRWITHFCAPVFVFLSGISAALSGRKKTKAQSSAFLIKRGFWLLFVEIVIITMGFTFNPFYNVIILQVIWAIGWGMIVLGLLVRINYKTILIIGIVLVFGHDLFNYITIPPTGPLAIFIKIFFTAKDYFLPISENYFILFFYAILPWAGLMLLGYCASFWFINYSEEKRNKVLMIAGISVTALFFVLRFINYGDPVPYQRQLTTLKNVLAFINASKYPPSLQYMCMTIGPALFLLAFLEHAKNFFTSFATVYGRVPFFYYVLHFYVLHTLLVILFYASGYGAADIFPKSSPFFFRPDNFGFSLPIVYLIWISVVFLLYFPCRWYSRYKLANKQNWLLHYL